jgi:membrane protease YdiL (CAAX protease family)
LLFNVGDLNLNFSFSIDFLYVILAFVVAFLAVSLFEESLFRDYLLVKFRKRFGTEKAILLSSVLFSLLHIFGYLSTGNLTVIGLFNAFLIGILLSVVVISTHSIMWVLGFHLFWNFTQTIFLDIEIGGIVLNIDKGIWAGTKHIPEAGLIVSFVIFILYIYILKRFDASYLIPKIKGFG